MAKRKRKKSGTSPGSLIYTGIQRMDTVKVRCTLYNEHQLQQVVVHPDGLPALDDGHMVKWLDVRGLHDIKLIGVLGERYGIHPLAMEDILDVNQRPAFQEYDQGLFLNTKALRYDEVKKDIIIEQVGIWLKQGLVVSFQEDEDDLFHPIVERLSNQGGRLRKRGSDYLTYALLDKIVDDYYIVLDKIEESIEELEVSLNQEGGIDVKEQAHHLKRRLLLLRKIIIPMRESVHGLTVDESEIISESTNIYLRDVYNHLTQVMETIETYRDMLMGLQDLYISELSFKMNNVMKVLTVISTIFIPLTFLVGVYGMNFHFMPELSWRYGYFILWGVMISIAVALLIMFKKRNWL
jgi:magnesium transporter